MARIQNNYNFNCIKFTYLQKPQFLKVEINEKQQYKERLKLFQQREKQALKKIQDLKNDLAYKSYLLKRQSRNLEQTIKQSFDNLLPVKSARTNRRKSRSTQTSGLRKAASLPSLQPWKY